MLVEVLGETLLPDLNTLTGNPLVNILYKTPLKDTYSPGGENSDITARSVEGSRIGRRVPAVHVGPAVRASAVVVAVRSLLPKTARSLLENSKNNGMWITMLSSVRRRWRIYVQRCGRYRSTLCIEIPGLAATETNKRWSPPARVLS